MVRRDFRGADSDGLKRGLVQERREVGADKAGHVARELLEVDIGRERMLGRVDAEDREARRGVGPWDADAAVEAAGPHQRGVEQRRAVRRGHKDDARRRQEAVDLRQQLVQRLRTRRHLGQCLHT